MYECISYHSLTHCPNLPEYSKPRQTLSMALWPFLSMFSLIPNHYVYCLATEFLDCSNYNYFILIVLRMNIVPFAWYSENLISE